MARPLPNWKIRDGGRATSYLWSITPCLAANFYTSKQDKSFTLKINPQQWLLGVESYFERKNIAEN